MEAIDNEMWRIRATAWELAAFSFRYPTSELVEAVASGEWLAAAREIAEALGIALPEGFGEGMSSVENPLADASVDSFFHELRAEATRLFVGPSEPACSPYEGVWRAKAEGVKPLLFVSTHAMEVERFVKACGFTRPEGSNDPFDHIATECELLEALALRAAQACDGGATSGDGDSAGASESESGVLSLHRNAAEAYGNFIDEHLHVWAADFCDACETETRQPFYRASAAYLRALAG